jgi:hypothetical protein
MESKSSAKFERNYGHRNSKHVHKVVSATAALGRNRTFAQAEKALASRAIICS